MTAESDDIYGPALSITHGVGFDFLEGRDSTRVSTV